jgi:hypothetical protein
MEWLFAGAAPLEASQPHNKIDLKMRYAFLGR